MSTLMTGAPEAAAMAAVDALYQGLCQAEVLLFQGRSWGLRVGLSQELIDVIRARHGDAAERILGNCVVLDEA